MRSNPFIGMTGLLALLALPVALAGCDDAAPKAQAAPAGQQAQADQARRLAETKLREELRAELVFSEVRTFPQAGDAVAVCGQVAMPGGQKAPFVSLVTLRSDEARDGAPQVEQHIATDGVSATRVYVETRTRCTDKAELASTHRPAAPPRLPAIPADLRTLAPPAPPSVARMEAEAEQARGQSGIAMRQNGNLRTNPNGGGDVIRVVPRGATLKVFAEAPGGWLQVGQQAPEGWMHSTMVTRTAPEAAPALTTAAR